MTMEVADKPIFLYVFDPLCGWCYGFHPVLNRITEEYKDRFEFQVISGGMVRGDRVGPIGEVAPYIRNAYQTVEQRTGVKFGEGFLTGILEKGEAIFASEPPAKAMIVLKQHVPTRQIAIANAIQEAIYDQGVEPALAISYAGVARKFGVDPQTMIAQMDSDLVHQFMEEEFETSAQLGVQGFPTVFLLTQTHRFLLARGYVPYEDLEQAIGQAFAYMQA